jgi:hypothetical protein
VATKTIKVSDLSGREIRDEENLARLVVEEHPSLPDSVTLEMLPDEVEGQIPEEQNFVRATYFPPTESGGEPRSFVLSVEDFNNLAQTEDMGTVLQNALSEQERRQGRRRGRRGRRAGERRARIDYASPEFAGMPHRGRVTEAEKAYVRSNLDEVNARRVREGHDPIDPTNPKQAEKYGLTTPEPGAVESEMQDQSNL